jgi:hypothetical protein
MTRKDKISRLNLHDSPTYKGAQLAPRSKRSDGANNKSAARMKDRTTKYTQDYDIMDQYERAGGKIHDEPTPSPTSYLVQTDAKDYDRGYIRRYFVVKYDGTSTTEVSRKWMGENGEDLPNIYEKFIVRWFVTDYSNEPIERGMKSTKAMDRNEFTVSKISNEFLKGKLRDNYIEFFMG